MFFKKKKIETKPATSFMSPIEWDQHLKELRKAKYNKYKKALDNIIDCKIIVDYNEALEVIDFLGTDNYNFRAMGFHDFTNLYNCAYNSASIEITKKQSKEGN